jgi:hypothetical protein
MRLTLSDFDKLNLLFHFDKVFNCLTRCKVKHIILPASGWRVILC